MDAETTFTGLCEPRPQRKNTLYVRYFGGFALYWNGTSLTGSSKSSETQFSYLMQLLLHKPQGFTRDELERVLFVDRDIDNAHHALQSVVYNAKRRLKASGLPDTKYIVQERGVFRCTDEIPVVSDVQEFKQFAEQAKQAQEPHERVLLYLSACARYTGEFLPNQAGMIWCAQEARRCRSLFCECVECATELLRLQEDYDTMEELGRYATRVDPLADWECVTMDSFVCRGMYEEARKLYDNTVQYYLQKQGLRPSKRLMEIFARLGERMKHRYKVLDTIQDELAEPPTTGMDRGYLCTYPVFRGIYRAMLRILERGGQSVYLMLCTVVDGKGNPMEDESSLEELSRRLERAICRTVRRTDIVNQYGRGQYLVLLVNLTLEDCKVVQKRINSQFIIGQQRTGVQYYVNSVIRPVNDALPDDDEDEDDGKERTE